MPWDPVVIREALLREHYRGGQSFIVTPRIADLPDIEEFLRETVPEVRYVVAHGQMAPSQVEERMSAFYERHYAVPIGRASCMDRGCKYVYISGDAESLKQE